MSLSHFSVNVDFLVETFNEEEAKNKIEGLVQKLVQTEAITAYFINTVGGPVDEKEFKRKPKPKTEGGFLP